MQKRLARSFLAVIFLATSLPGCLFPKYEERIVEKDAVPELPHFARGRDKICVIPVDGVLLTREPEGSVWGPEQGLLERVTRDLRRAAQDPDVKAAVLKIDSPGGEVTAAELLRVEVLRFRASDKPLVAYFEGVAASGGYYLAAPADRILMHPTALTGSIGVIAVFPNVAGLMGKLGIDATVVKSGPMKDAGSPLHAMRPEEERVFQALIDDMYERFLKVVVDGRKGMTAEGLKPIADGRVYTSAQAIEYKLVDEIATFEKAILAAAKLAGLPEGEGVRAFRYELESPGLVIHLARAQAAPHREDAPTAQLTLNAPAPLFKKPGFWYLWWPGAGN